MQTPQIEPDSIEALEHMNKNLKIVLALMDLADIAAIAFNDGDYQRAFKALGDYHALRQEHVEI